MMRVILLSALFAVCWGASVPRGEERIIGGTPVGDIRDEHYVVSIRRKGTHICGGAIISLQHVITAAECVYLVTLHDLTVHSGSKYLTGNTVLHQVIATYNNPYYRPTKKNFNVAILHVSTKFDMFDPVHIGDDNLAPGRSAMTYGWGVTVDNEDEPLSPVLQELKMKVMYREDCAAAYSLRPEITIDEHMICTEVNGTGICRGDFGGPLIDTSTGNHQLYGVSFKSSLYCLNSNYPDVFFLLESVRPWIKSIAGV